MPAFLLAVLAAFPIPIHPRQDDAVHDELRALKSGIEKAFNQVGSSRKREDLEAVLDYVTDRVVLTAMNGQCVVGKQGLIDYFERTMVGSASTVAFVHHEFNPEALSLLYGGDTAVSYGSSLGKYQLTSGLDFDVDVRWTCTMVKEGERWLIASFQFAPSIFDNPLLERSVRTMYWVVGGAALLGLLVGFFLFRTVGRRS